MGPDRIKARDLGHGFWQIEARFGFAQTPNLPRELSRADLPGLDPDLGKNLLLCRARQRQIDARGRGMARWREHLYIVLTRLATRSTEFFRLPPDRVIELGAQVDI